MLATFGKHIIQKYFGIDKRGEEISIIIDKAFMKEFCVEKMIPISFFFSKINLWTVNGYSPIETIIGFIGLQLYAVSNMESNRGYTANNYRDRLCDRDILNINVEDWQNWAKNHQENIWNKFYQWCSHQGFELEMCSEKTGRGRYVQYPIRHGRLMFRQEDLNRIAALFVHKGLRPGEDISENEFYKLLWPRYKQERYYAFKGSWYTPRTLNILETDVRIGLRQIFHYYLRWDGYYIEDENSKKCEKEKYQLFLLKEKGVWSIDIINVDINRREDTIKIDKTFNLSKLNKYYKSKYPSRIIFKKNPDYDDYWEETRYIQDTDDEGIAIMSFKDKEFYDKHDIIFTSNSIVIVRIYFDSLYYNKYYAENRCFKFIGGLKIDSNTYLQNCLPYIETSEVLKCWIDGELKQLVKGVNILNLNVGAHFIKFKGYKQVTLKVISPKGPCDDSSSEKGWQLCNDNKKLIWNFNSSGKILGLDFSEYSKYQIEKPFMSRTRKWIKNILYDRNSFFIS